MAWPDRKEHVATSEVPVNTLLRGILLPGAWLLQNQEQITEPLSIITN